MNRLILLISSVILISCNSSLQQIPEKPNIVFIMADDMGYGDVGIYNPNSKIPTPNMDQIAREGMYFTDAHSPSSVCSPTRYGVLTGRYAWRTWLKEGGLGPFDKLMVDTARYTVADLLKDQGYATAIIGKWHMGLTYQDSIDFYSPPLKPGPLELGFDYFFGINHSLNMSPLVFIENHHTVGTPNVPAPPEVFTNHGNMMMVKGWRHEEVGPTFTRKAVEFINKQVNENPDQPFYLHLMTSAPHRPLYPPDFIRGRSQAGKRGDMVAEVDWTVGEVVKTLKEKGIYENTLIVVTSDNGAIGGEQSMDEDSVAGDPIQYDHQGNYVWRGRKTQIWEGGHRVPFIARWPGKIAAGTSSNEHLCLTDWMATVAGIFEVELPVDAAEDSYNMLPVLLGQPYQAPLREALVSHSAFGVYAIRQGKWKLIEGQGSGGWGDSKTFDYPPGQLYDMEVDSLETNNLYEQHPEVVESLENLLEKYRNSGRSNEYK
ncbi:MAG: sulfatase family protein [Cyclobacteriaceae bacterium]